MLKLRGIETIRKQHNFVVELSSIPAVDWMKPGQTDYDEAIKQTVGRLEVVDNDIETMISKSDENMRLALGDANYSGKEIYVRELRFPSYLPRGKVQLQRDVIRKLVKVAKGKPVRDLSQEIEAIKFQAEWEVNPKIGIASIDDKETELRLRNSLRIFSGYLNACEHEFYKQILNAQLDNIFHHYHMLLQDAEFRNEKAEPRLMSYEDRFFYHWENILDRIYYSRAMDYLVECRNMWNFLNENEYSKGYLLRMEDVHPGLKK